jgi:hypothetical protein
MGQPQPLHRRDAYGLFMAITTTLSLGAPLVVFFCPICRSIYCRSSSTYPTRGRVLDFNTGGHHGLALGTLDLGWNPVVHARIYQPMGLQVGVSWSPTFLCFIDIVCAGMALDDTTVWAAHVISLESLIFCSSGLGKWGRQH